MLLYTSDYDDENDDGDGCDDDDGGDSDDDVLQTTHFP